MFFEFNILIYCVFDSHHKVLMHNTGLICQGFKDYLRILLYHLRILEASKLKGIPCLLLRYQIRLTLNFRTMKTLKNKTNPNNKAVSISRTVLAIMTFAVLCFTSIANAQYSPEVEFDVYANSAAKASRYLLANDVSMRDCASQNCTKLTTIRIGTNVRLLAKSKTAETINGVTSRWYKVKMGPQTGWIWGGLIAQKTMISHLDPEVKFLFGEAGKDVKGNKRYQIRAVAEGVELDKIIVAAENISHKTLSLLRNSKADYNFDVIRLTDDAETGIPYKNDRNYVVFINDTFKQTSTLDTIEDVTYYQFSCEDL